MRPVGQGRPGTEVIPPGWEEVHRPVAEKTMTATAYIRRPGTTQEWDEATQQNIAVSYPAYYDGRCRVQAASTQAKYAPTVEDDETATGYLITVPADVDPVEGHLVTVTNTGDPGIDGAVLVIRQVLHGSLRFERDLICTLTT